MYNTYIKGNELFFVRLGLGFTFLYSGYSLITGPAAWLGEFYSLPAVLSSLLAAPFGAERYLQLQGGGELILAFVMLGWFMPSWTVRAAAAAIAFEMAGVLLLVGINSLTFRDSAILGAALFLAVSDVRIQHNTDAANQPPIL